MVKGIFKDVQATAFRMGGCEPKWLKLEQEPEFLTVEEGDAGPEILLLHGLLGALSNWDGVMSVMGKFGKPIALHFPILTGHRSEVRVKALAAFTEYFIRGRKIDPIALCGNSLGGHVAIRLCLASPEMVDCLILAGTSGLYEHTVDSLPVRPNREFIRDHMERVFHQEKFVTAERIEEIYEILNVRMNTLNLIHAARSAKRDNLLEHLKEIEVPTLLLWGEDDEVTTMSVAESFHKHLPNSELITIKNCGHAPMIEYPEWFCQQVHTFLKKHSCYYTRRR